MTACPLRSCSISAAAGFWTRSTTSALTVEVRCRHDGRAGVDECLVRNRRSGAGIVLDEHVEARCLELGEDFGYQGDAPLSGRGLLGDTDLHGHHLGCDGLGIPAKDT